MDFHKVSVEELCARFHTDIETGLTSEVAAENQKKYGPNELTPPPKTPGLFLFPAAASTFTVGDLSAAMVEFFRKRHSSSSSLKHLTGPVFRVKSSKTFHEFYPSMDQRVSRILHGIRPCLFVRYILAFLVLELGYMGPSRQFTYGDF